MSYFTAIYYGPKPIEILHINSPIELKKYLIRRLSPLGYTITTEFNDERQLTEFRFTMQFGKDYQRRNVINFVRLTHSVKGWFQEWIDQAEREYINRNLIDKL